MSRSKMAYIRIINTILIFLFITVLILPLTVNAFEGRNNNTGTHMELTAATFQEAYQAPLGKETLERTVPLFEICYYRFEPCRAVNFLADASRDTDLFYFGPLYPHAQSPSYKYKKSFTDDEMEAIETKALLQYFNFMNEILGNARRCYNDGDSRAALYWLGFYLHGYEDLFAHKGITNEQHIWLEKKIISPDEDQESIRQCRASLPQLAVNLPSLIGGKAGEAFRKQLVSDTDIIILTRKEREKILRRKPDIFWEGIKYKFSSANDSCMRYLNKISWDYKAIVQILNSSEAMTELASIKDPQTLNTFLKKRGYDFWVNYIHSDRFDQELQD